jgi:hypothetical protein
VQSKQFNIGAIFVSMRQLSQSIKKSMTVLRCSLSC